jgi:DNA invertase Pin-like site-specific DNA recombinase
MLHATHPRSYLRCGNAVCNTKNADRLGRSLQDLIGFLSELHALGVDLMLHQQGLDTTTPAGKAMFQMMGVFAEFERAMIRERVKAGLERARAQPTLAEAARQIVCSRCTTAPRVAGFFVPI